LEAVVFEEEEGLLLPLLPGIALVGEKETEDGMGAESVHDRPLLLSEDKDSVVGDGGVGLDGPVLVFVSGGVVENSEVVLSGSG
jgi:hypothetical protein